MSTLLPGIVIQEKQINTTFGCLYSHHMGTKTSTQANGSTLYTEILGHLVRESAESSKLLGLHMSAYLDKHYKSRWPHTLFLLYLQDAAFNNHIITISLHE